MMPKLYRISSMNYLSRISKGFIFVFLAVYLLGLGLDGLQIGFLLSLLPITSLFVGVPTGIINDRYDIRYTILLGNVLMSAFFLSVSLVQDFLLLIPLFVLGGMGQNIVEISYKDYIFKDREPHHEGRKYGTFTLCDVLSFSTGGLLGGILAALFGLTSALIALGAYFLAISPLLILLEPERVSRTRLIEYRRDFLRLDNVLLSLVAFLLASHWGAEMTAYGPFLQDVLGLDRFLMGAYYAFSLLFLGLAAFVYGNRIDRRTDFRKLFIIGLLVSGLAHILMTIPQVHVSLLFRSIHEAGDGLATVSFLFWLGRKFKRTRIGGDSEMFFLVMTLGNFLGALVYGPIGFSLGYSWPLIISGVVTVGTAGIFHLLKSRLG